jgi:hypothetical protein
MVGCSSFKNISSSGSWATALFWFSLLAVTLSHVPPFLTDLTMLVLLRSPFLNSSNRLLWGTWRNGEMQVKGYKIERKDEQVKGANVKQQDHRK